MVGRAAGLRDALPADREHANHMGDAGDRGGAARGMAAREVPLVRAEGRRLAELLWPSRRRGAARPDRRADAVPGMQDEGQGAPVVRVAMRALRGIPTCRRLPLPPRSPSWNPTEPRWLPPWDFQPSGARIQCYRVPRPSIRAAAAFRSGGRGGIRTHGALRHFGFRDRSVQPLRHPSMCRASTGCGACSRCRVGPPLTGLPPASSAHPGLVGTTPALVCSAPRPISLASMLLRRGLGTRSRSGPVPLCLTWPVSSNRSTHLAATDLHPVPGLPPDWERDLEP